MQRRFFLEGDPIEIIMGKQPLSHTLPIGYRLNERYVIDSILGEGGFGITYKAIDSKYIASAYAKSQAGSNTHTLSIDSDNAPHFVAIKEYYPSGIAARSTQGENPYYVTHFEGKLAVSFNKGIERFRQEAYLLKEFSHLESIVSILDIFDANNTTFIVMEYIEGLTIQNLVRKEGAISFDDIMNLMKPLLKDLSVIHKKGLIHRDISPDNLLIGLDNKLHLIDFGSANHSNLNASKTYTVILKAGYAPPEQYIPNGKMGPWTDVYGICATIYYALTKTSPMDSLARMQQTNQTDSTEKKLLAIQSEGGLEEYQMKAILTGLSLSIKERYPSVSMLLNSLTTPSSDDRITEIHTEYTRKKFKSGIFSNRLFRIIVGVFALLIVLGLGFFTIKTWGNTSGTNLTYKASNNVSDSTKQNNTPITAADSDATEQSYISKNTDIAEQSDINKNTDIAEQSDINKNTDIATATSDILTMVNFTGWSVDRAISYLSSINSGIQIHTVSEYSNVYDKDKIINQSIKSNTQFTKGSIANMVLTVSKGKEPEQNAQASKNNPNTDSNNNTTTNNATISDSNSNNTTTSTNNSTNSSSSKNSGKKKDDGYTTIHIGD